MGSFVGHDWAAKWAAQKAIWAVRRGVGSLLGHVRTVLALKIQ